MDISRRTEATLAEDLSWVGSAETLENPESGTLDVSAFTAGTHYPNGFIPSGMALAKLGSGKWGPFSGSEGVDEVQKIAVDATGGTFTISIDGETTAAIAATASAATVQAALELLDNVNPGDITVTGGPGAAGGATPYVLTYGGRYDETNVPAVTTGIGSLTGGAGTAAVTTFTGGAAATGSDYGHLATSTRVQTADNTIDVGCAICFTGTVRVANLPANHGVDADFKELMSTAGRSVRYI